MEKMPIKVMIVEDDVNEYQKYKDIIKDSKNIKLVSITNSSSKAMEDYKIYKPDAIILDLELNEGEGSGLDFITRIKEDNNDKMPKIIVTTKIHSEAVYDFCHKNDIDFIFYKQQKGFSNKKVIDTLLLLSNYDKDTKTIPKIIDEKLIEDKVMRKINKELDLIGIGTHLTGRKYLCDAIYYVIQNDEKYKLSIVQQLVSKYKKSNSTISRAMQNAILYAWRIMPLEDLNTYYTARINYETGVPTPTELIYFYADKIKKEI